MRIAPIRAALTVALLVILAVPASASAILPPPLSDRGAAKEAVSQASGNFQIHPPNNGGHLATRPLEVLRALVDEE